VNQLRVTGEGHLRRIGSQSSCRMDRVRAVPCRRLYTRVYNIWLMVVWRQ